jgi:hypothetical protein
MVESLKLFLMNVRYRLTVGEGVRDDGQSHWRHRADSDANSYFG